MTQLTRHAKIVRKNSVVSENGQDEAEEDADTEDTNNDDNDDEETKDEDNDDGDAEEEARE